MINATSELNYLYRGLRALVGFRLRVLWAWLRYGHWYRRRAIQRYLLRHETRKLHLGATFAIQGFLNSQILGDAPIDVTKKLPLPSDSFSLVYSSHLVEHLQRLQFRDLMQETWRVLKPGGQAIVATPSLEKIVHLAYGKDSAVRTEWLAHGAKFYNSDFHTPCHQINLAARAFGHRFLYDFSFMVGLAKQLGFARVEKVGNFDLPDEQLVSYLQKRKPRRWDAETETYVFYKS